jgi:hypothetical protein
VGTRLVDERHRTGGRTDAGEKLVVNVREDIDDGIAYADQLDFFGHCSDFMAQNGP